MTLRRVSTFRFRPRAPYSFVLTIRKPAGWHWMTPFEVWDGGTMWTGFWFRGETIGVKAREREKMVSVEVYARKKLDRTTLSDLERRMRKALGVDEDIRPLYRLMRKHKALRRLVRRLYGMREGWASDIFPSLTLAVLLQMAPIGRSERMWDCLIRRFGARARFDGKTVVLWPHERAIARASVRELKRCKLGYRARNLVRLARQLLQGFPTTEELERMPPEEAEKKLMELYGIGEYSAGFASPHPSFSLDVWSVKIFHRLLFGKPAPKKDPRSAIERTTRAAERAWGRWRGYVLVYVLNDLPYLEKRFGIAAD